jgi:hypothetical protein
MLVLLFKVHTFGQQGYWSERTRQWANVVDKKWEGYGEGGQDQR